MSMCTVRLNPRVSELGSSRPKKAKTLGHEIPPSPTSSPDAKSGEEPRILLDIEEAQEAEEDIDEEADEDEDDEEEEAKKKRRTIRTAR